MQKPLQNCIFSSCNLSLVWCFQRAETDSKWSKTMKSLRKTLKTRFFYIKKYFFFDKTKKCKILHPHCMHYFRFVEKKTISSLPKKLSLQKTKKVHGFVRSFVNLADQKDFVLSKKNHHMCDWGKEKTTFRIFSASISLNFVDFSISQSWDSMKSFKTVQILRFLKFRDCHYSASYLTENHPWNTKNHCENVIGIRKTFVQHFPCKKNHKFGDILVWTILQFSTKCFFIKFQTRSRETISLD